MILDFVTLKLVKTRRETLGWNDIWRWLFLAGHVIRDEGEGKKRFYDPILKVFLVNIFFILWNYTRVMKISEYKLFLFFPIIKNYKLGM